MNNNVTLEVCFRCRERELNNTNFSAFNSGGTTGKVRCLLVDENETIDQFRVINSATKLGCYVNVVQITVGCGFLVNDLEN